MKATQLETIQLLKETLFEHTIEDDCDCHGDQPCKYASQLIAAIDGISAAVERHTKLYSNLMGNQGE